jgi:hypothetical protein
LRLVEGGVERFYLGHGGPLDTSEVRRHAESLSSLPQKSREDR